MKRRVGIAQALLNDPSLEDGYVWLMQEQRAPSAIVA